ncbi:MAG: glycosyltransferase [Patescibacteria group bacterium]
MKKNEEGVTLIVPCYNEETNIQTGVLDKIGNYTKQDNRFIEVLIVDDGSSDHTKQIIQKKYLPEYPKFRLIENAHQGKAFAIMKGIQEANGEYIIFSDFDLATPIEEAEKLIAETKNGYKIVIGSRKLGRKGAPFARKLLSYGAVLLRNYFIDIKGVHDTQCGFKLFHTDTARKVISKQLVFKTKRKADGASVSAGFDMEFLFVSNKLGYKIKEVPVVWRHVGSTNVTFIKDAKEALKDILTIKYNVLTKKYDFSETS